LSFAAITAIVALHEHPRVIRWFERQEEGWPRRALRGGGSLLLTGLVVEVALMPIAIYHFHKAGLYGAAVNIVAIPLTTFVIMPIEAIALIADVVGMGAPFWWIAGVALHALLAMAHWVSGLPGASTILPAMPVGAFALMIGGGLWIALWRTPGRWLGIAPLVVGAIWAGTTPAPDLLVTGDGRHVAIRTGDGLALLRERTGDYTRSMLAENAGVDGEPLALDDASGARCSQDACIVDWRGGRRSLRILATRSIYPIPFASLMAACSRADIVISDRRLPRTCQPTWLKLDRPVLVRTGGVAVTLSTGTLTTVRQPGDRHPWRVAERVVPPVNRSGAGSPKAFPARGRDRGGNVEGRMRDSRDRAAPSRLLDGNI
jgi:competence protein ComEC